MRNVVKGFQYKQLAIPKMHEDSINKMFGQYHTRYSGLPRMYVRQSPREMVAKNATRPGKNPGIRSPRG